MTFKQFYENWIKPSMSENIRDMLRSKGWNYMNSGSYGSVYSHPKKNYVVKIYTDKGYRVFLDFLESQQGNPDVVKIKRRIFKNPDEFSEYSSYAEIVALEKLKPIPMDSLQGRVISNIWAELRNIREYKNLDRNTIITKLRENLKANYLAYGNKDDYQGMRVFEIILKRNKNLIDTLFLLKDYINNHNFPVRFDLHSGNFMIRPSTGRIVITDPLANSY